MLSKTNILDSAQKYLKEFYEEKDWYDIEDELYKDDKIQYSCVSIEQLKGKGFLDKNVNVLEEKAVILLLVL